MGITTVDINNQQTILEISPKTIQKTTRIILDALDFHDGELSIVLMNDAQITPINREYLNRDRPTNVIAFSMLEGSFGNITPGVLGDVLISLETAIVEALNADLSINERFCQLLVHGILHIFGYDHEKSKEDAAIMDGKSRKIMKLIANESGDVPGLPEMIRI